jgi:EAL domain-containing protein (putative c-di-GMP-specific phosphodiesterase class I)/CheY-like chemotaxis protein
VPPDAFIPLAEDTGLIVPIGAWVLDEACHAAARWPAAPDGTARCVSVNVSARQLRDGAFVATVTRALAASGLAGSRLCLEITESLLMTDMETSRAAFTSLKELGVRLSVDDFGTGYSSLARLKRFPIDYLKIDRSFVDGLGTDQDDEAISASIVALAHSMGLAVIAEGVETPGQEEILRELRCEGGQGWLWSKALPEPDFRAWLTARDGGSPVPAPIRRAPALRWPPARSLRVLVVDDDPDHLELVGLLLGAAGHEVVPLRDPFRFLESLVDARPDLVLVDLRMPGRGGLELVQDLEADGSAPPVVAVTGHADWTTRPLLGVEGLAGVIAKPIDPETFAARVESYVSGPRPAHRPACRAATGR